MKVGDSVSGAFRVSTGEWLNVRGRVVRTTAKAVLIESDGQEHWCPRSTCRLCRADLLLR